MKMSFDNDLTFDRWCDEAIECAKYSPWDLQDWIDAFIDDFREPEIKTGELLLDTNNEIAVDITTYDTCALCPEFWKELKETVDYWKSFDD